MNTINKARLLQNRRWRIRKKVVGTAARPRLAVRFSTKHIYAQAINDDAGATLVFLSSLDAGLRKQKLKANLAGAKALTATAQAIERATQQLQAANALDIADARHKKLEEAAIDGIPAVVIDPRGDLANLLLAFPGLAAADFRPWLDADAARREGLSLDELAERTARKWRDGLAATGQSPERIGRFRDAVEMAVPVQLPARLETVAAFGETTGTATQPASAPSTDTTMAAFRNLVMAEASSHRSTNKATGKIRREA